jgi:ribosome biogenesis GTPase
MILKDYGWDDHFEQEWRQRSREGMFPGRVSSDYGQMLRVVTEQGEMMANRPIGKQAEEMQIAAGDWAALENLDGAGCIGIRFVLNRKTKFSRKAAGPELKEQIVAANADVVFLIQSLNRDFNMRRLERYLIAAWESGAMPAVVLTKADCCEDVAGKIAAAQETAPGAEVHAVSCYTGEGMDAIRKYFQPGKTIAFLGSSGVGKSTLANSLAGEELLETRPVRESDSRGRHTTTHRELILLPEGGLILDTPGMRALSPWEADTGMDVMFGDVEDLTKQCRFYDCRHHSEPGCAVRAALKNGTLDQRRWESWEKLQKELRHEKRKESSKLRIQERYAENKRANRSKESMELFEDRV